jgi:allophanate hydrolase subunit 2
VIFGPDAPTTRGYPVVAVLREVDLAVAAQLRPGDTVRFTLVAQVS